MKVRFFKSLQVCLIIGTLLLSSLLARVAQARPVAVFDMDHTLVDTNYRILAILHDIGVELKLPQLLALQYDQVEALKSGDLSVLQINDAAVLEKIFGNWAAGTKKTSLFGRRFYFDSSYLKYDKVLPGAAEFVEKLALALDAHILYLTGRTKDSFEAATVEQLNRFNFPGFGARSKYKDRVSLILKPDSYQGETASFKAEELSRFSAKGPIAIIFDDSIRNANAFIETLPNQTVIVRLSPNVLKTKGLNARIEQITNYLHNIAIDESGKRIVTPNAKQLDTIIDRAKSCAGVLTSGRRNFL